MVEKLDVVKHLNVKSIYEFASSYNGCVVNGSLSHNFATANIYG